jgi:hypothetical protein
MKLRLDGCGAVRRADPFAPRGNLCQPDGVDASTGLELVKLLLQVAFADDEVSAAERLSLDATARRLAGDAGLEVVKAAVDRRERLPPPNMGLLSKHRAEVLKEVARLGAVDGIHADELDMVATIGGMLR